MLNHDELGLVEVSKKDALNICYQYLKNIDKNRGLYKKKIVNERQRKLQEKSDLFAFFFGKKVVTKTDAIKDLKKLKERTFCLLPSCPWVDILNRYSYLESEANAIFQLAKKKSTITLLIKISYWHEIQDSVRK